MKFIGANLQRDVLVLTFSRGVRAFGFSYLNIIFAIYLSQLGYSTMTVGLVISTAFASGALLTAVWGFLSDRYGRKKILILLAAPTIVSNTIYVFFSHLIFIFSAVMISSVGAGGTGGGGQGGGPFNPVEQALLAEKCTAQNRNRVFATNAFAGSVMASLLNIILPLAPTFSLAAAVTISRSFLAYLDNPLRSSFIMGVVKPEERGSAAGITNLSRQVPMAISPTFAAYLMQSFSLNVPIFVGGSLQLIADCSFYFLFRNVRPPEEQQPEL